MGPSRRSGPPVDPDAASLAAGWAWSAERRADERVFPHLAPARRFPSFAGCHGAIVDSAAADKA